MGLVGHHWEKTARSGMWWFRGALEGEGVFFALSAAGDWGQERIVLVHTRVGRARLSSHRPR